MAPIIRRSHLASSIIALAVLALTALGLAGGALARPDYRAMIDETGAFLSEALNQYKQGNVQAAKARAEAAYFEVYENLEGPIRINTSAKTNYALEQEFVGIRKMIVDEAPAAAIEKKVADFIAKLRALLPVLEGGVDLIAESSQEAKEQGGDESAGETEPVVPVWRDAVDALQSGLDTALETYNKGDRERAAALVIQSQYDHYKNSLFETAVRRYVSHKKDFQNNSGFTDIAAMMHDGRPAADVEVRISGLVRDLREDLPGLPLVEGAVSIKETTKPASATREKDWAKVTADLFHEMDKAMALYQKGEKQGAISLVQNAYFDVFEASGMEAKIGARDAGFTSRLEGHFSMIVSQMKAGASAAQLDGVLGALKKDVAVAAETLGKGRDSPAALFFYSLMIILREGIEAILIITAIIAYLVRSGNADKLRIIYNGCISALVMSAITAVLVKWVFKVSAASQEVLEGATMLLASAVLFSVSYWLISKAEAQKWLAYIKGKVGGSLSANSLKALWFAAFLAVYREGAETVLFYQALVSNSSTVGVTATAAGFALGCVLLIGAYAGMRYGAVRLPIRPFFLFTGALLYYMSFVFAGKGVMEFIEGKLFEPSLISWAPAVPFIGVFPYVQTLLPQLVITLAAVAGLAVMARQRSLAAEAVGQEG